MSRLNARAKFWWNFVAHIDSLLPSPLWHVGRSSPLVIFPHPLSSSTASPTQGRYKKRRKRRTKKEKSEGQAIPKISSLGVQCGGEREGGRKEAAARRRAMGGDLYALDFDGVLCDSCGESSLSAVKVTPHALLLPFAPFLGWVHPFVH